MFCKECGAKHPPFINYCPNDGQELLASFPSGVSHKTEGFCAGCGNSVHASAQYCQHCGESHSTLKIGTAKKVQQTKAQVKGLTIPKFNEEVFSTKTLSSILIAVGLSIILVFAAAFLLKSQVENVFATASGGEITAADIQSIERYLAEEIEYETGMAINLPNVYNIFTYIPLMHGVDFELSGEIIGNDSDEYVEGFLDVNVQNLTVPLLLIALLVLILSGIGLGYLVKKHNLSLWQSIAGFSALYGVFIAISSFIASFSYKNSLEVFYSEIELVAKGSFPLIESFLSGAFLALAIAGSTTLIMVYGKQTLSYLHTKASYIQYLSYSAFLIFIGLFVTICISIAFLIGSPGAEDLLDELSFLGIVILGACGMWIWNIAHLLPVSISNEEYGETETLTVHLFNAFSDNRGEVFSSLLYTESMPLWISLSFLIPALLLAAAGYHLYKTHTLNIVELLKFSAIYGVFMVIIKAFTTLKMSVSNSFFGESQSILWYVHSDLLLVFIVSSLFALAFISAGGFLKRYLSES